MKLFYVGVKGVVIFHDSVLILKRKTDEGYYWDCPGGRADNQEDLGEALGREIVEETGISDFEIQEKLTFFRLTHDIEENYGLVLLYYKVIFENDQVVLSSEHDEYQWIERYMLSEFVERERTHMNDGMVEALLKVC